MRLRLSEYLLGIVLLVVAGSLLKSCLTSRTVHSKPAVGGMMMPGAGADSPLVGKPAPRFTLKDTQGKSYSLSALLKSHAVVLYFYKGVW